MNSSLFVDDRWSGLHGIGRYAAEVLSRLRLPHESLGLAGSPSSPIDVLRPLPRVARQGVIYSPGYNAFLSARRQVLTLHDLIHLEAAWPARAKYAAYYNGVVRPAVRRAGTVVTVSEASRNAINEWLRDDSVSVVNAGIATSDAFTLSGAAVAGARPAFVYVGNLRAHKNVPIVIDALRRVPDADLRMLIPVVDRLVARELAAARGVSDRVHVLSGIDDEALAAEYRGATATLMPSLLEGFGLPPLESVLCGTPVIHWEGCASVRETVGERGYAVKDAGSAGQWAEAMNQALQDRRRVEPPVDGYGWDRTTRIIEKALLAAQHA